MGKNEQSFLDWEEKIISFPKSLWKINPIVSHTKTPSAQQTSNDTVNLVRLSWKKEAPFCSFLAGTQTAGGVTGKLPKSQLHHLTYKYKAEKSVVRKGSVSLLAESTLGTPYHHYLDRTPSIPEGQTP